MIVLQQALDHVIRGKWGINWDVPAGVGLHHSVLAPVTLRSIQVDDSASYWRGDEGLHLAFDVIDLGGPFVTVVGNLFRCQGAVRGGKWRYLQTRMRHRDKKRELHQ
jgi:hypothetical protein